MELIYMVAIFLSKCLPVLPSLGYVDTMNKMVDSESFKQISDMCQFFRQEVGVMVFPHSLGPFQVEDSTSRTKNEVVSNNQ